MKASEKQTFDSTEHFDGWLDTLDELTESRIAFCIRKAEEGKPPKLLKGTDGIYELSVDTGPGYRLYCYKTGRTSYRLLNGGDKDTQEKDIRTAMEMHRKLAGGGHG